MMKKMFATAVSALMVLSLSACGGSATTATTAAKAAATTAAATTAKAADTTAAKMAETTAAAKAAAGKTGGKHFEIVSKGFQHQYWQAVLKGAKQKAQELGDTINFVGPDTESDIAQQVQMLNNAINAKPDAIGLAALDTKSCLDGIKTAQAANIAIIGFDSGVPDAPAGSVKANCSTDNYAAGQLAAEKTYAAIKDKIAKATATVRIGILSQDAVSESVGNRGLGFIDKMGELCKADGKTVNVEGNDKFVTGSKCEKTSSNPNVVMEVLVPAQVDSQLSANDCQTLLNKADIIAVYGSNQHSGEAMVTGDENLNKFGTGEGQVIGVAFDSGKVIKGAVKSGKFLGAVTQAPVAMGAALVQSLDDVANGKTVKNVDTGCQWYTKDNMDTPDISQNLYD